MSLSAILALGLVFGMHHALEADHLAAVATLAARERGLAGTLRQGVAWGIGHTLTLLAFGGAVLLLGAAIPDQAARWLEMAVGAMLVVLGMDLLRRMVRDRVHFHAHRHAGGARHFHAHSHRGEPGRHDPVIHHHQHARFPGRAIMVGMVHGLAGSAALVLVALDKVGSPFWGALYVLLFGVGSIVGMALLSVAISLPLHASAARLTILNRGVQGTVAVVTIALGVRVLLENAA